MTNRWQRWMALPLMALVWVLGGAVASAAPGRTADLTHARSAPGAVARGTAGLHAAAFDNAGVIPFGRAGSYGAPTKASLNAPIVAMAATSSGKGYVLVAADGGVFAYGDANFEGSAGGIGLYAPIVGIALTPTDKGYWLVALDGGVFTFGDATFYGSMGGVHLNQPIVGIAATPTGNGYWLVAQDGGIFSFGGAAFYGSTGAMTLNSPINGMAASPSGKGYYLVAADGGVFTFGNANFYGSTGGQSISSWVSGMAVTPTGAGYWLAGADGVVYRFGDAVDAGSQAGVTPTAYIGAIVANKAAGGGYWLLEPDAFPTAFSHPASQSSIVTAAAGQIQGDPNSGYFCNPYGPCEAWCALFATWAWESGGVPIPRYAFVGDVFNWAAAHTAVLPPTATPAPGDAVLYGTGPQSVATAVHMGIVAQVWPDGAIDTVEGDAGPGVNGYFNVIINGPFLPGQSPVFNGVPIFAFAVP